MDRLRTTEYRGKVRVRLLLEVLICLTSMQ